MRLELFWDSIAVVCNADRGELQILIDLNPFLFELITELLYVLVCMVCVTIELYAS